MEEQRPRRQLLLRGLKPMLKSAKDIAGSKPEHCVKDIFELRKLLQSAVELEHTTIPPYLCALYSIKDGTNHESVEIIQSVVMEEMLHMILAANVLNAIGGQPSINHKQFIPEYPKALPVTPHGQTKQLMVGLERFSKHSIETFIKIEEPDPHHVDKPKEPSCLADFHSIGQFYEAIEMGLKTLSAKENIFTGKRHLQVTPEYYYGGGGKLNEVTDLDSALEALVEIVSQGEGQDESLWEGQPHPGVEDFLEVAHFFRFDQIRAERCYQKGDTRPPGPTGAKFKVDWNEVYPMRTNPKLADYPKDSELWQKTAAFNKTYRALLDELHYATNGEQKRLMTSVPIMYELKYQAVELMKIPTPDGKETAGPSFE